MIFGIFFGEGHCMLSTNRRAPRLTSRWRRVTTAALTVAVLPALLGLVSAQGAYAAPVTELPDPKPMQRVKLDKNKKLVEVKPADRSYARFDPSSATALPAAQTATVSLAPPAAQRAAASGAQVQAGSTPVRIARAAEGASPQQVQVTTADPKAADAVGVRGMLFSLRSLSGKGGVAVDVDDSTFRNAYGGDYASRLRLVSLPACALTTPSLEQCRTQTPLRAAAGSLSAEVSLASASSVSVLAATAGTGGESGNYAATSLSPGGTWGTSGNTGAFTYNYPLTVPPPVAGLAPTVKLGYVSSSQDARTAQTNNQSSWAGDGWSTGDSFIERTYKGCDDVKNSGSPDGSGDQCWAGQILTMSLNGSSSQIVYDDKTKAFHPMSDSSTIKIEKLSGAVNDTKNNEYWHVIENGVHYYFGMNRLPGWAAGDKETKSAWTVPVYKAHAGVSECPDGSFADTACTLGYRFNLDYVVDPNGNAMAYYYAPDDGYYGANMKKTGVKYTRGGVLERIDYGLRPATIYSGTAPVQIKFETAERCLPGEPAGNTCAEGDFTVSHPAYWPDVPIDLNCVSGTDCDNHAPSFWSRKRLKAIATYVKVDGVAQPVDRYELTHTFPDNGDHAPTLWLDSIKHIGKNRLGGASADASVEPVRFVPRQLKNRVGTIPGLSPMYYHRIGTVFSETGAETVVEYDTPTCAGLPRSDPADAKDEAAQKFASTNTTACFPAYWTPDAQPKPLIDWFYTHPVLSVTTYDTHNNYQDGSAPRLVTEYKYEGKPAWHYDDNEVVKEKYRTWGQFRGYPEVHVITGDTTAFHHTDKQQVFDRKTLTKAYYFQGMDGDTLPGDKTRSAPAKVSQDGAVTVADRNEFSGQVFESETYTGLGGTVDSSAVTVPQLIGPTASRARDGGLEPLRATMVRTAKTYNRKKVSSGWRKTESATFYNTDLGQSTTGMAVQSVDRGEPGATGNVTSCTFTRYLDGSTATLVVPAETVVTDQDCTAAKATPSGKLLSATRTAYDNKAFAFNGDGQASPARPAKPNATLVQTASTASGATASAFVDTEKTTYDALGRVTAKTRTPNSVMADGTTKLAQTTYSRFTPAENVLPTSATTVTQVTPGVDCSAATKSTKDCQVSSEVLDPARQLPKAKTDIAGFATTISYDAFGRTTGVWLPNRNKAAGASANVTYDYKLSNNGPSVITTKTLLDNDDATAPTAYKVGKVLYDAMLRKLETQDMGENGSVIVSDTQYDTHGRTVITNNAYAAAGAPVDKLISDTVSQVSIPSSTVTDYDGLGRATLVTAQHNNVKSWSTRTAYAGDKTTVIPPAGGIATTSTVNARGQLTRLQQYTTAPTLTGSAASGWTATGGTSNDITYAYTPAGQQSSITGPDGATWTYAYDLRGRKISQKDPDTGTSLTAYDDAGNVTGTRDARSIELNYTYDLLGRKLTATDKSRSNFKFASWTYDTLRAGELTSSSRYVSGVSGSYTVAATGYSVLGKPMGQTITLPAIEQPLPTSYTTTFAYTPNNELLARQESPSVAGLPGEAIAYGHSPLGSPTSTGSAAEKYVSGTMYTDFGQPSKVTMGDSTNEAQALYYYDEETLRLDKREVYRTQAPGPLVDELAYTYDDAGNPLSVTNKQAETGNITTDTQCYRYNGLARLTEAWTAASACGTGSTPAAGGVSSKLGSYWQSFTYNAVGDRTKVVDHSTSGATDLTTEYAHGCTTGCNRSGAQPHTLTGTTGGLEPTKFVYDAAGNMLTRTPTGTNGTGQKLDWDSEGRLAKVTTTGAAPTTTQYLYDADGSQLIRRDPGRTTLFAGDTQIVIDTSADPVVALGAIRTYTHGGSVVAMRSTMPGGNTSYLFNDHHGTAGLAMDTTTQQVARQQFKPYGEDRASANATFWPDPTRGYLGAPRDTATGYTDLGARKYDPKLGRFISADPLLQPTNLNELGGYTYAGDNPITLSDPTGLAGDTGNGSGNGVRFNPDNGDVLDGGDTNGNVYEGSDGVVGTSTNEAGDPVSDPSYGCSCGVSEGFKTGSRTKPPKFVEYAIHYIGGCQLSYGVADQCHMSSLTKNEKDSAWASYLCTFYHECGLAEQREHNSKMAMAEWASWVPGVGVPYSLWLADQQYDDGDYVGAGITLVGLVPMAGVAGKAAGKTAKGAFKAACSFDPATHVLLADGTTKPIGDISVGDKVLATDPETGETSGEVVTVLHDNVDTDRANGDVVDSSGVVSTLQTTQNHPFWSVTSSEWTRADKLRPGDRLRGSAGETITVDTVRSFVGAEHMRNLTVTNLHTYFVVAGVTPVLVHNAGACKPPAIQATAKSERKLNSAHRAFGDRLAGRSQFFDQVTTDDLIARASNVFPTRNAKGDWVYQVNFGSPVGVDRSTGLPTEFFTLVTNSNGHMVSAYPGMM